MSGCVSLEYATRLEVKLLGRSSPASRPSSTPAALLANDQQSEKSDERLLELPPTLALEAKQLPHLVVCSVYDRPDDTAAYAATPVVVVGESRRQLRLRVFEGAYEEDSVTGIGTGADAAPVTEDDTLFDNAPTPQRAPWYFLRLDEPLNGTSVTNDDGTEATMK